MTSSADPSSALGFPPGGLAFSSPAAMTLKEEVSLCFQKGNQPQCHLEDTARFMFDVCLKPTKSSNICTVRPGECIAYCQIKVAQLAPAGAAQGIEHWPTNQRVTGLIPSQGTRLGWGTGPQLGHMRGNHTLTFLSFSFSFPSSLSKNK